MKLAHVEAYCPLFDKHCVELHNRSPTPFPSTELTFSSHDDIFCPASGLLPSIATIRLARARYQPETFSCEAPLRCRRETTLSAVMAADVLWTASVSPALALRRYHVARLMPLAFQGLLRLTGSS